MVARLTYVFGCAFGSEGSTDYEFALYGGDRPENLLGSEIRRRLPLDLLPALRDAEGDLANWRRSPLRALGTTPEHFLQTPLPAPPPGSGPEGRHRAGSNG